MLNLSQCLSRLLKDPDVASLLNVYLIVTSILLLVASWHIPPTPELWLDRLVIRQCPRSPTPAPHQVSTICLIPVVSGSSEAAFRSSTTVLIAFIASVDYFVSLSISTVATGVSSRCSLFFRRDVISRSRQSLAAVAACQTSVVGEAGPVDFIGFTSLPPYPLPPRPLFHS